jgi:catechol 2,3-dioxygenase-like lactoylglutathione lyase family enzyme
MPIADVNHLTVVVSNLERSMSFYVGVLGARPRARWLRGAYLELGSVWLCLEVGALVSDSSRHTDDSHVALTVDESTFPSLASSIGAAGARVWKANRSEGASLYFEDPDGHKWELHVGDLATRLRACRKEPYEGMIFYDEEPGET